MAANSGANRVPKQWQLTSTETLNSFKSWKDNFLYSLAFDPKFNNFLADGEAWGKESSTSPFRGFTDDEGKNGIRKKEKLCNLNLRDDNLSQPNT